LIYNLEQECFGTFSRRLKGPIMCVIWETLLSKNEFDNRRTKI